MTNEAKAVAWLVTNGGESCEPWLVWEQSEVNALPSQCIAEPLYPATEVERLEERVRELEAVVRYAVGNPEFNSMQFTDMCKSALARSQP